MIASDASGRDDHRLGAKREFAGHLARTALSPFDAIRLEDRAGDPLDGAIGHDERIDAVAEFECEPAARLRLPRATLERFDNARTGAPAHMKSRHRIAVAHRIVAAALGPAHDRKDSMAHGPQPSAFFPGREP